MKSNNGPNDNNIDSPGGLLPVVWLHVLLVVDGADVHVVRGDDHLLGGGQKQVLVSVPFLQARGAKVTLLGCGAELFTAGVPVPRPSLAVLGEEVHSRSRRKNQKKIN